MQLAQQPATASVGEHTLESLVDELRSILQESLVVHQELLAECQDEASALRQVELDKVRAIIDRKVALAGRTIRLETRREQIIDLLSPYLSLEKSPTVSEIAALLPRTARLDLNHLADRLAETIGSVTRAAARNRAIAQGGVHIATNLLASLSSTEPSSGSYSIHGRVHPASQRPIIEITG